MGSSLVARDRVESTSGAGSGRVGWFVDPLDSSRLRFFDGDRWTNTARPRDGGPVAEPGHVPTRVLLELPAPGERARRRRLRRWLPAVVGFVAVASLVVATVVVAPWPSSDRAGVRGARSSVDTPLGPVLFGDGGWEARSPVTLTFVVAGGDPVELWSFGEGCVVESGASGVEYRLGTSTSAGVEVGVAAIERSSGYQEVSVVVRGEPTEPEQLFVFSSDGAGSGSFDASVDGSGFTVDAELVDVASGVTAQLSGSAACG